MNNRRFVLAVLSVMVQIVRHAPVNFIRTISPSILLRIPDKRPVSHEKKNE